MSYSRSYRAHQLSLRQQNLYVGGRDKELRGCPMCGFRAHVEMDGDGAPWSVLCNSCGLELPVNGDVDSAIKAWNTRRRKWKAPI